MGSRKRKKQRKRYGNPLKLASLFMFMSRQTPRDVVINKHRSRYYRCPIKFFISGIIFRFRKIWLPCMILSLTRRQNDILWYFYICSFFKKKLRLKSVLINNCQVWMLREMLDQEEKTREILEQVQKHQLPSSSSSITLPASLPPKVRVHQ